MANKVNNDRGEVYSGVYGIHGSDLISACANRLVHLLTFGVTDGGVLFCYHKNMKLIQCVIDTRNLVMRLYAYGRMA